MFTKKSFIDAFQQNAVILQVSSTKCCDPVTQLNEFYQVLQLYFCKMK